MKKQSSKTDRQTDTQTNRQTKDGQTDRKTDRLTDTHRQVWLRILQQQIVWENMNFLQTVLEWLEIINSSGYKRIAMQWGNPI